LAIFHIESPSAQMDECKNIPDNRVAAMSRLACGLQVAEHGALDALDDKALANGNNSKRQLAKRTWPDLPKLTKMRENVIYINRSSCRLRWSYEVELGSSWKKGTVCKLLRAVTAETAVARAVAEMRIFTLETMI
jgi:hypothetical protein